MSPSAVYWATKARLYRNWALSQGTRPTRSIVTGAVLLAIWYSMFLMWSTGLGYLAFMPWIDMFLTSALFGAFTLFVFLLMIVTSLVLHTAGLYHSGEASLLMHMPIAPQRAAMYRSTELSILNSLGAVYLVTPLVAGILTMERLPGWPPVTETMGLGTIPLLLIPFLAIPNLLGAIIAVCVRRVGSRLSTRTVVGLGTVSALVVMYALLSSFEIGVFDEDQHPAQLIRQTRESMAGTRAWFLPSFWYTEAVFSPMRGNNRMTLWFGAVLVTAASACLVGWAASIRYWFYPSWLIGDARPASSGAESAQRNLIVHWTEWLRPMPEMVRTLMAKDLLLFARDPVVRTQGLMMVGPLLIYFAALRTIHSTLVEDPWHKLLIGTINFAALGIMQSAFGCRFLMPLISIEGQKFWLLRMAPPKLTTLLLQKWLFGSVVLVVIGQALLALSNYMTTMDRVFVITSHATAFLLQLTIAAICVGMGAIFPDLREGRGTRALNGTAATLALVLCFGWVMVALALESTVFSVYITGQLPFTWGVWNAPSMFLSYENFLLLLSALVGCIAIGGALFGALALASGHARLQRLEIR